MNEVCLVPTYRRQDLLVLCFEHIRRAAPDMEIHCFPDRGSDERDICNRFGVTCHLTWPHTTHGNSANVMEMLKWAKERTATKTIFVVEDDVLVDQTYFDWSRQALKNHPDAFAACGWQPSPDMAVHDGPDYLMGWYLSVCAALPRRSLEAITQHSRLEYYVDLQSYLDRAFPTSHRRGSKHYEQDGLALRVMESEQRRCVWPRRPRAQHCGWYSDNYHATGKPLEGTLDERVSRLRMIVQNPDLMKMMLAGGPLPEMIRCQRCDKPLLGSSVDPAICRQCFHSQHPAAPVTTRSHYYVQSLPL